MDELPQYIIEAARSGRSRCKVCRRQIAKDALRLGILIEGPYGTGYLWHHLTCAAKRRGDDVEAAYEAEAWRNAKSPPEKVPSLDSLRAQRERAERQRAERRDPPYVEIAPSGRSRCKHCEEPIEKGTARIAVGRTVTFGNQERVGAVNVHPRCLDAELDEEHCATEREGLIDALRANRGDLDEGALEAAIVETGLA